MKWTALPLVSAWLLLPLAALGSDPPRFLNSQLTRDKASIYYSAQDPSTHKIYLFRMNLDGTERAQLLQLNHPQFTVLTDEQEILTQSDGTLQLRELPGGRILWELEDAWNASITTNGEKIVFVRATETRKLDSGAVLFDKQDYFLYDVASRKEKRLTYDGDVKQPGAISRNGDYFAYVQYGGPKDGAIQVVDIASGEVRSTTIGKREVVALSWTSGSDTVVFSSCGEEARIRGELMPSGCSEFTMEVTGEMHIRPVNP